MINVYNFILVILIEFSCFVLPASQSRFKILSDQYAEIGQFPFVVFIKQLNPCTGVILNADWIITTAQCVTHDMDFINETKVCMYILCSDCFFLMM